MVSMQSFANPTLFAGRTMKASSVSFGAQQQQSPAMHAQMQAKHAQTQQDSFAFRSKETTSPFKAAQFAGTNVHMTRPTEGVKQLNQIDQLANNARNPSSKTLKALGSGVGWAVGAAVATGILVALPVAATTVLGFVPLMHWLWPIAGFLASAPLVVGGVVGALRGLHVANKK